MYKSLGVSILASALLAACQTGSVSKPEPHVSGQSMRFSCSNGLNVQIRSLNPDRIELRVDDKQAVLSAASSASGERYVGNSGLFGQGAEWHQKGGLAMLEFVDPYGNRVETDCQAQP